MDDEKLADECHVVRYPVKNVTKKGELVFPNGEVDVYLCGECFNENEEDVIKEYE